MNISAKDIFPEMEIKNETPKTFTYKRLVLFLFILYVFLFSLAMMSKSAQLFDSNLLKTALENPFVALVIGLLATAIFQSSSTTTSMLVALVGSGAISITEAIPVVMGANIGTTITAIITSVGHISGKKEFRKAVSGAFMHHYFKILTAIILFPLEYYFQSLSKIAIYLSHFISAENKINNESSSYIYRFTIDPLVELLTTNLHLNPVVNFIVSLAFLFLSIRLFIALLKNSLIGESQLNLDKYVFGGPIKAFSWGMFVTALIHSSTATTSFMVPLVATDKVSLRKAYPFIIGANIGTTFTALVAALSKSSDAMSIALAHFLFNFIGMMLFFITPYLRETPLLLAKKTGAFVLQYKSSIFIYVVLLFFLIPFLLIALSQ